MGVPNADLLDLINTTLKDLPNNFYEIMWNKQKYEYLSILRENNRKIDGGPSIQRNVILDEHGRAKFRRLYDTDTPTVDQNIKTINVPWTQFSVDYSWDELEIMRNRGNAKGFINLMEERRTERLWSLAELLETRGWLTPTSATDDLYPYGVPYYINMLNDGVSTGGFLGQTIRYQGGTTGTTCAGLDAATEPKWRNYADTYTKVDNALIRKLRSAVRRTRFQPPAGVPTPGTDSIGSPIKIYSNDTVVNELIDLADKRDDNNTPDDLANKSLRHNFNGETMFNGMPIVYVPALDSVTVVGGSATVNTPDPIYCIDWSNLQPFSQEGYFLREGQAKEGGTHQHTVFTVFMDGSYNNLCRNRRTVGWVLHKTITA